MKTAAIYARVSSDQQREDKTIASQTAALKTFASSQAYSVPVEWIFEDEGFSGATLVRPGLERVRDLVADGQIQAVLVLSPDRLSRKYAYQVLLTEEWLRQGVETIFIKAPQSQTPEDQLLLQFQGMIAEYERAQILERSRRGKRHRAKQGQVSVLSGPDGHFKFPHLWPLKLPQAGRSDYGFPDPLCVDRNAAMPAGRLSGLQSLVGLVRGGGHRGCFDPLLQPAVEASEARQAVGIGRGAVGKPRTPQGPSTGLSCGRVACPRRARVARTGSGGVGAGRAFAAGP